MINSALDLLIKVKIKESLYSNEEPGEYEILAARYNSNIGDHSVLILNLRVAVPDSFGRMSKRHIAIYFSKKDFIAIEELLKILNSDKYENFLIKNTDLLRDIIDDSDILCYIRKENWNEKLELDIINIDDIGYFKLEPLSYPISMFNRLIFKDVKDISKILNIESVVLSPHLLTAISEEKISDSLREAIKNLPEDWLLERVLINEVEGE